MSFWISLILCFQNLLFANNLLVPFCNEGFLNGNSIKPGGPIYCQDSVNIRINGVPILKQPKSQACWAATITMLILWKSENLSNNVNYSPKEAKQAISNVTKKLGKKWFILYEKNLGLSIKDKDSLISVLTLESEPPANHMLEFYIDKLKTEGPLWVTTSTNPTGVESHAKLLIGIQGDMTYENTYMEFIDPLVGKIIKQKAIDFVREFENEAVYIVQKLIGGGKATWDEIDFRIQIFHW